MQRIDYEDLELEQSSQQQVEVREKLNEDKS
jgi:hypothetical protein